MSHIIQDMPEWEVNQFFSICSTIGAYIVFPSRRIDGKPTINGARGLHHKIRDRFDLTLECIRRHYGGQVSPLSETLARYADFFALFGNFEGYADYFLLKDLVSKDGTSVSFFIPFRDFDGSPLPGNVYEYRSYKDSLVSFVIARNDRMARMAI